MSGLISLRFKSCLAITRQLKVGRIATNSTFQTIRKISFRRKKSESAAIDINPVKSEYDIELEKVIQKTNFKEDYGYHDDPYLDKFTAHLVMFLGISISVVFTPILVFGYGPDFRNNMVEWRKYEAVELLEAREARGEPLLSQNFAPPELIESMVPPSGDWEEEWLGKQPSIRTKARKYYWVEAEAW